MGWLRLVGSLKLRVSCAQEPYKRDDILQKRPIILRTLLILATPYTPYHARICTTFWHPAYNVRDFLTPCIQHVLLSDTLHMMCATFWHPAYNMRYFLTPSMICTTFWHPAYNMCDFLTSYIWYVRLSDTLHTTCATFWHPTYDMYDFLTSCIQHVRLSDTLHMSHIFWRPTSAITYGVAMISRFLKIIGLFSKRAL